jgi:hypothetical protein
MRIGVLDPFIGCRDDGPLTAKRQYSSSIIIAYYRGIGCICVCYMYRSVMCLRKMTGNGSGDVWSQTYTSKLN